MTDSRAALRRVRAQVSIDPRKDRNFGSDGGDASVGPRAGVSSPLRFVGGFALGALVGTLVALIVILWKRPNTRRSLARAGGPRGMATAFVQRLPGNRAGSQGRAVSIADSGGGSAIEREIRGGAEGAGSMIDETGGTSRP